MLQSPVLQALPWLTHGFTARSGGLSTIYGRPDDLNLGFTAHDNPATVRRNRALLLQSFPGTRLVTVRQVHGTAVLPVRSSEADPAAPAIEADALVTAEPGILLGIQAADCVPILLADRRLRIIAAVHAGWRGTAAAIAPSVVARMAADFGTQPADLVAAIGPSIGPCCYRVGQQVHAAFAARETEAAALFTHTAAGTHLDLWQANRLQLIAAGLSPSGIHVAAECTACTVVNGRRKYFSHRAEHSFTGRAMGLIGLLPRAR